MKNINNEVKVSLIKSLLYIWMDQPIYLKILRIIIVMTCGYQMHDFSQDWTQDE